MNIYNASVTDGSSTIYFTVDPIISPLPNCERQVKTYTSVISFTYSGTLLNPRTHIIDGGVPLGSGILSITFQHLDLSQYNTFAGMFASLDPPTKVTFYDYRQNISYTNAIMKNLKSDYIEGVKCSDTYAGTEQRQVSGSFELHITGYPS